MKGRVHVGRHVPALPALSGNPVRDAELYRVREAILEAEVERLTVALLRLNTLRACIVATGSSTWDNTVVPLTAVLTEAGFEDAD